MSDPTPRPPDFRKHRSYRRWFEETYVQKVKPRAERSPAMMALTVLAVVVMIFICSVPCLIFGRVLYRFIMGN